MACPAVFAGVALKKAFDLPAGDAASTLVQFSVQAGGRVLYSSDAVTGVRTKPVKGELTPLAALGQMLAGTSLTTKHDEKSGTLAIVPVTSVADRKDPDPRRADSEKKKSLNL